MTDNSRNETSRDRAIGRLEGKLDSLIQTVETSNRDSATSRAKMRERMENLGDRLTSVEGKVDDFTGRIERLEPFAEKANRWEQRGIGALAAAGMIGSGLTAVIATFWKYISALMPGN